ncbi:hypothetical protein [Streptomyces sp. NPDC056527]|uniref:hypothetical protein n=1 Tax=Streptomyces sp. NPDC056527 TaxID=3345853 RepID=UPI0036915974
MDAAILSILGVATVAAIALFSLKGLLDQVPDLVKSWRRAKRAFSDDVEQESTEDEA